MTIEYPIEIHYSKDDHTYIASVPQLTGCLAHGESYESAARNIRDAMELWIQVARENGETLPEPRRRSF